MLTMRPPIQLHIAQGLTGGIDSFCERIRGNYNLLGAQYTPKDLLFLLTAPPDLPEETGGMTTLVSQQNNTDIRSVTMDVVNNVVNRIMIDGTEQFTYQDQVYITSVLNRLGITNIEQFMAQVRQLRSENESTVHLTQMYRDELKRIIERKAGGENAPYLPIKEQADDEAVAFAKDPKVEMSLNILKRLDTTKLYETVHNFQRNWVGGINRFQHNEFKLAEQLRFGNTISLAEIKQQFFEQPQLHLLHHLNRYETGAFPEVPQSEEAVLSQAAAAALVNAIDNTVVEVLNRPQIKNGHWLNIQNAVWQTAENTLSRFETYHNQYQLLPDSAEPSVLQARNYYSNELTQYQSLYHRMYPKAAEYGRFVGIPDITQQHLTYLTKNEMGDELLQEIKNHITESIGGRQSVVHEQQINEHSRVISETEKTLQQALVHRHDSTDRLRESLEERFSEIQRTRDKEAIELHTEKLKNQIAARGAEEKKLSEVLSSDEQTAAEKTLIHRHDESHTLKETVEDKLSEIKTLSEKSLIDRMKTIERSGPSMDSAAKPISMTLREAEENSPEVLVEQMTRIDQRNRTIMQAIEQQAKQRNFQPLKAPDIKQTMAQSLKALEEPERFLQQLYSEAEPELVHRAYTPQEEAVLTQADPVSRAIYEKIVAYQKDPEGALAQGIVKNGSMGALQAEMKKAEQYIQPQMEHIDLAAKSENEIIREQTEVVIERLKHIPGQARWADQPIRQPNAVRFVHKQETNAVSEEILEQLEQKRTQKTVMMTAEQQTTEHRVHQADMKQIEHKVVNQTTEDITELVNRTLARQMKTISDQVYRQMEKRLQSERSRRGRM